MSGDGSPVALQLNLILLDINCGKTVWLWHLGQENTGFAIKET